MKGCCTCYSFEPLAKVTCKTTAWTTWMLESELRSFKMTKHLIWNPNIPRGENSLEFETNEDIWRNPAPSGHSPVTSGRATGVHERTSHLTSVCIMGFHGAQKEHLTAGKIPLADTKRETFVVFATSTHAQTPKAHGRRLPSHLATPFLAFKLMFDSGLPLAWFCHYQVTKDLASGF